MTSPLINLAQSLLNCGDSLDCHQKVFDVLTSYLADCGPKIINIEAGGKPNLYLEFGNKGPLILFLGHSDVVSTGDLNAWRYPPFSCHLDETYLWGRGSVDMRAAVAAMAVAIKENKKTFLEFGRIGLVVASDEETKSLGTPAILNYLRERNEQISLCIVGEPSAKHQTGDKIKIGRRGGISGHFIFQGKQGHTAYLQANENVLNKAVRAANSLLKIKWPKESEPWPEQNFHITNFFSGSGENNTTPPSAEFKINMRYGPSLSREKVIEQCSLALSDFTDWEVNWTKGFQPYFTTHEDLIEQISSTILKRLGTRPELATDGGTSDGRFFGALGIPTIEIGTPGIGLHEINEAVKVSDLTRLVELYKDLIVHLLEYFNKKI